MGLFSSIMGVQYREWNPGGGPDNDFWYDNSITGIASSAGIRITPAIALQTSAVFACVKVISETMGTLPLPVYERVSDREKRRAYETNEYRLLCRTPNEWQTPYDFKENLTAWASLHGKGIGIKHTNGLVIGDIEPVHPSLVRVEKLPSRRLRYWIRQPDGTEKPYVQGEILHIRGFAPDGLEGLNLSQTARDAIGLARAMEQFASRYFANDTTVGLTLEHPGKLSPEAKKNLTESLERGNRGIHAFRARVLEEGMKLNRIDAKARDAQLTDERLYQVVEICRFFRMPPHKIAHLINATFSNIEHQAIEFVQDTITPWAVRWEEAVTRDLIVDDEKYFAEFLLTALLRGDNAARSQYYRERFNIGTMSRNEIRALENENPIPGGDRYYIQGAMVPLDESGAPQLPPKPAGGPANDSRNMPPPASDARAQHRPALLLLIEDAADRIVRAEQRELEKRTDKASADVDRFVKWADGFYATHATYAARTLAPLVQAAALLGAAQPDANAIAQRIADDGRRAVSGASFASNPTPIIAAAQQRVVQRILHAFFPEDYADAA